MTWNSKVVWSEGMFLRPQHFQQQDRYLENLIRESCRYLRPYDWGVGELTIDREALSLGKIALARCHGLLPDGTPFSIPDNDNPPSPLDIDAQVRDTRVLLALPLRRLGMPEVQRSTDQESFTRYRAKSGETRDNNLETTNNSAPLEVGQRQLRLILDSGDHSEYACVGIARIKEKLPDQTVVLDEDYLPPCLDCRHVVPLQGFIKEILGLLHQRGDALADRLGEGGTSVNIAQFLRLQVINRYEPWFDHLAQMANLHPEPLYQVLLQLAGELSTFASKSRRRPVSFPSYQHDDLQNTFAPVLAELRKSLSMVEEQTAIQIPLETHRYGIRVAAITDREKALLTSASFVLAVQAEVADDVLRNRFPAQVKIGPVERIAEFVNHHIPGIGLSALPVAPREIPFHANSIYFRLDQNSEFWKQLLNSGGFAFHIAGEFPGIEMTLWAIKD